MSTTPRQHDQRTAYQQPVDEVLTTLNTDAQHGLNAREAQARLDRYGTNELTAEKPIGFPGTSEKFRTLEPYHLCE